MMFSRLSTVLASALSRLFPLAIVLLGAALYGHTLEVPFVFDDSMYIVDNRPVRDYRYFVDRDLAAAAIHQEDIDTNFLTRKMTAFTFALNYHLHGLSLPGYHLVNILIHLACGLLLYQLVAVTLQTPLFRTGEDKHHPDWPPSLPALFAALFFVAHPVQTEAVTYLCQRFTSLATLFYLLALLLYANWRLPAAADPPGSGRGGSLRYGLALTAAVLAMFCKEIAFTLPLVLIAYEWLFFGRPGRRTLPALLPFAATMLIIPAIVIGAGDKYADVSRLLSSLEGEKGESPALTYLFTQFPVIVTYLRLLVLPINQNLDYDFPRYVSLWQPPVLTSLLLLCLIAASGAHFLRRAQQLPPAMARWHRLTAFGIFWFFIALAVESTVMPLKDLIFEHRIYLPSAGFFLALVGIAGMIRERLNRKVARALALVLLLILAALSGATIARNTLWQDPILLWEDTVRKSPQKTRPLHNLGEEYAAAGRYDQAIGALQTAVRFAVDAEDVWRSSSRLGELYLQLGKEDLLRRDYPTWLAKLLNAPARERDLPRYYNNLGIFYAKVQQWPEAEAAYRKAIALKSDMAVYHLNLAWIFLNQKRPEEALPPLRTAEGLDPEYALVQECLGDAYLLQGKEQEALQVYLRAQQLNPVSPTVYQKIVDLYSRAGNLGEAGGILEEGARVRGEDPSLLKALGNYYERMNRPAEAEKAYLRATRSGRNSSVILKNLGDFYLRQGRLDRAVYYLEQAATLDPLNPNIHYNLGHAFAALGNYRAATGAYERVLSLSPSDVDARQQLEQMRQFQNHPPLPR